MSGFSLQEWALAYVKHRDLFQRRIAKIESSATGFSVTEKEGVNYAVLVADVLDEDTLPKLRDSSLLITLNRQENVQFLISHWKSFLKVSGMKIIFAHPEKNEKWVLVPQQHDYIAEPESLEQGLLALAAAVPEA